MDTEKMRPAFEAAMVESGYMTAKQMAEDRTANGYSWCGLYWRMWKESRASVVIELPMPFSAAACKISPALREKNEMLRECRDAIEAAGVTVRG